MTAKQGRGSDGSGQADAGSSDAAVPLARQPTQAELREARAAQKLRENLMRRKAQTRARRKGEAETGVGLPAAQPAGLADAEPEAAKPKEDGREPH